MLLSTSSIHGTCRRRQKTGCVACSRVIHAGGAATPWVRKDTHAVHATVLDNAKSDSAHARWRLTVLVWALLHTLANMTCKSSDIERTQPQRNALVALRHGLGAGTWNAIRRRAPAGTTKNRGKNEDAPVLSSSWSMWREVLVKGVGLLDSALHLAGAGNMMTFRVMLIRLRLCVVCCAVDPCGNTIELSILVAMHMMTRAIFCTGCVH
jgi:hypothetical protein